MHIPENYLNPATCTVMVAAMLPVWKLSIDKVKIQIKKRPETVPMIGIGAAFSFLIMMFNFPLPGGTTAHAIGAVLIALLLGPYAACLSVTLALILQAFLFGDGGILALGANTFNMAFIMPFVGYGIYWLFARKNHDLLGAGIGSYIGIVAAAFSTSIELGIQPLISHGANGVPNYFPYGLNLTIPIMAGSHLLVGIVESLLTVLIYSFVKKSASKTLYYFNDNSFDKRSNKRLGKFVAVFLGILALLTPIGLLATGSAWGEWSEHDLLQMLKFQGITNQLPKGIANGLKYKAIFSDYQINSLPNMWAYILIALTVFAFVLIMIKVCQHDEK